MAPEAQAASVKAAASASRAWDALTPPLAEWILDAVSSMGFKRYRNLKLTPSGRHSEYMLTFESVQDDACPSQYDTAVHEK